MEFQTLASTERPSSAPKQFTVFEVGEDRYVFCPVRQKAYKVTNKPEEIVRQWWLYRLGMIMGTNFPSSKLKSR